MPIVSSMPFGSVPGLSRTRIDRSGVLLKEFFDRDLLPTDEVAAAFGDLVRFRAAFQRPLDKTVMGLRSMVSSEWPELSATVPVTQRLKRREQMLFKLSRMRTSKLSNMGDIGGCRAVLDSRSRVDGVFRRIKKNWDVLNPKDTRDEPEESGYRALHVIVVRDGRRIEVQLRERQEHDWAVAVERTGKRLGIPLKEGLGPDDLKEYFRMASEGIYLTHIGKPPDEAFEARFVELRGDVQRRYFSG